MIKLIVLDLDGTLLKGGVLSSGDAVALRRIQENGTRLMIATGRNLTDASDCIDKLQLQRNHGVIALSDGQYLQDYADHSLQSYGFLSYSDDLRHVLSLKVADANRIGAFSKTKTYQVFQSAFSAFYGKALIKTIVQKEYQTKALFVNHNYQIDDIEKIIIDVEEKKTVADALSHRYDVAYVHDKYRYEIKRKGVNKGAAVEVIQNKYGYQHDEIAVFGNDENDVSMFERYKISYVVEDAPEHVKRKAMHVISQEQVTGTIAAILQEGARA